MRTAHGIAWHGGMGVPARGTRTVFRVTAVIRYKWKKKYLGRIASSLRGALQSRVTPGRLRKERRRPAAGRGGASPVCDGLRESLACDRLRGKPVWEGLRGRLFALVTRRPRVQGARVARVRRRAAAAPCASALPHPFGYWLLFFGYWLLFFGYWLLFFGYWLLFE
jgi:hypothetical protein